MNDEMKSMKVNGVWDLVSLPEGAKLIGCKLILTTKKDVKGKPVKREVCLVTRGFTKKEGIDYEEIFFSICSKDSCKTISTLVAHYDLYLHQMKVKTFCLNGFLKKTIYIEQLECLVSEDTKHLVCKLKNAFRMLLFDLIRLKDGLVENMHV